ncbi:hypothetical protein [Xanthovirga aplysinae]|uniref:hypothetical protein n=1 Tax=Xanthovirga aplysinae TaxID=2529853 RepID=UPI0012BBCE2E|nr:hypothetical protein [Xanthovirga aplysinae]MTI33304.1 hypothetical protein [Xanthovirga aplysinae]
MGNYWLYIVYFAVLSLAAVYLLLPGTLKGKKARSQENSEAKKVTNNTPHSTPKVSYTESNVKDRGRDMEARFQKQQQVISEIIRKKGEATDKESQLLHEKEKLEEELSTLKGVIQQIEKEFKELSLRDGVEKEAQNEIAEQLFEDDEMSMEEIF